MARVTVWAMAVPIAAVMSGSIAAGTVPSGAVRVARAQGACDVMDDALATKALNSEAIRDTNPQSAPPGMCTWHSRQFPGDALTVAVDDGGRDKYDFDHQKLPVRDLPGVGDEAFAFISPAGFVQMGMMTHGIYVTILLQVEESPDRVIKLENLARTIAARL